MTNDCPKVDLLAKALAAELATVDAPQDTTRRLELVAQYRRAGLAQPAEAELARLLVQFSWDHGVLADVLDLRRHLHRPGELLRFAKIAESLPDRSEGLQLALGQAFAAVGELEAAAKEFGALLQTDSGRKAAAGAIATFVRSHPDLPALRLALIKLCYLHPDLLLEPPLRYAVFRAAADLDKPLARQQLGTMFHPAIETTDLILDVAVQAWRLGQWDDAARAARQVLTARPPEEQLSAARLLVSIRLFAGDAKKAAKELEHLPRLPAPVRLDAEVVSVLKCFVADEPATNGYKVRCATIVPFIHGRWRTLCHAHDDWSTASDLLEARPEAISVSTVGPDWRETGPYEILAEVDFVRPHLMVQLGLGQPFVHAFRPAEDEAAWPWQEVPIHIDGVPQSGEFCWLAAPETYVPQNISTPRGGLWQCVKAELRKLPKSMEGNGHERTLR